MVYGIKNRGNIVHSCELATRQKSLGSGVLYIKPVLLIDYEVPLELSRGEKVVPELGVNRKRYVLLYDELVL